MQVDTPRVDTAPVESERGKLSDYTVEKRIGKGQFSTVYKGTRIKDNLFVAIKKIPIHQMQDVKARNDCIKEIDLLKVSSLEIFCDEFNA